MFKWKKTFLFEKKINNFSVNVTFRLSCEVTHTVMSKTQCQNHITTLMSDTIVHNIKQTKQIFTPPLTVNMKI